MRWVVALLAIMIAALCFGAWELLSDSCPPEACDSGPTVALSVPLPVDSAHWTMSRHRLDQLSEDATDSPDIVKRFARDDIWTFSTSGGGLEVTRWDGTRRRRMTPPLPDALLIEDITGTGSDDIWISGSDVRLGAPGDRTGPDGILAHWNGRVWERVPATANVIDVASVARNDVWALFDGKIMHGDGHTWTPASVPEVPMPGSLHGEAPESLLSDIIALAANDVWAVGTVTTSFCCDNWIHHREVVMHWDGHAWNLLDLGIRGLHFSQAVPDGHGGLWIATRRDGEPWTPIAIHYRGGHWTKSTLPRPDGYQSVQADQITITDKGRILLSATAYAAKDGIPTTVEYSLTS
ncbi:hypothetical protein [Sphaerisporangium perillae]|uniref:hypothetical protein n=1 Tax=Sphaerisporangium perillae TaxID=2935860 RepID=UPI00200D0AC7|nr:hypothetical protein [Sphaerisporangium perillae]